MKKLNKKGFTLVELIVVIAIIGILAAVLVPSVTSYIGKAQKSSAQQNAANKYQEYVLALVDQCHNDVASISKYEIVGDVAVPTTKTTGTSTFKGYYINSNGYTNLIVDGVVVATEKNIKSADTNKVIKFTTDDVTNIGKYGEYTIVADDAFIPLPELNSSGSLTCPITAA